MLFQRGWVVVLAVFLAFGAASAAESAIVGKWKMQIFSDGAKRGAVLNIVEQEDGKLAGTWGNHYGGESALQEVKFRQGILTFWFEFNTGAVKRKVSYTGLLNAGALEGQLKTPRSALRVVGERWKDEIPAEEAKPKGIGPRGADELFVV